MEIDPTLLAIYGSLDLLGVALNGVIGGTMARQRGFDIVGFSVLAITTALGGGIVRDLMLQQGPPAAVSNPLYLGMAILGGLIAWTANLSGHWWELFRVHGDSTVLGVWAATGAMKAMTYGVPWSSAILMGVITAVGGGMIRDVLVGQIPTVFGGNTLYAVPALIASSLMTFCYAIEQPGVGMIVAACVGSGLAIVAYWRGWSLHGDPEWAPVNMTAAQLRRALLRAERKGFVEGVDVTQEVIENVAAEMEVKKEEKEEQVD